ncbi:MAG: LCP family protein [Nitriliruptoraceae bacterium]
MSGSLTFSTNHRPRGARVARGLGVLLVIALALLLLWALVIGALWSYAWFQLGGDDIPALRDDGGLVTLGPAEGPQAPRDVTTLMVTLTGPVDPTIPRPPELEAPIVLLQIGGTRERPAALILPEDVPLSGEESFADVQAEGGTDPLLRAVIDYTGVRVDHVVSLSVDALPRIVDAVGTLEEVCRADGCAELTGDEIRSQLLTADDQELVSLTADVLRALGGRVDARWAATSPRAGKRVIDAVDEEIVTDVSLRGRGLLDTAAALEQLVRLEIDRIPVFVNPATGDVVPLPEQVEVRLQRLRDGEPLSGMDGQSAEEIEADLLADIEVAVLNGAGVDGLAARLEAEITSAGFEVRGTGNAPTFDRQRTLISFARDDEEAALAAYRLSELLGDVEIDELDQPPTFEGEEIDVLLIAGEDAS